jgi:hypothetical protein
VYLLTILFLVSRVTTTSVHSSLEVCERLAEQARSMKYGMAAVESARCELISAPVESRK